MSNKSFTTSNGHTVLYCAPAQIGRGILSIQHQMVEGNASAITVSQQDVDGIINLLNPDYHNRVERLHSIIREVEMQEQIISKKQSDPFLSDRETAIDKYNSLQIVVMDLLENFDALFPLETRTEPTPQHLPPTKSSHVFVVCVRQDFAGHVMTEPESVWDCVALAQQRKSLLERDGHPANDYRLDMLVLNPTHPPVECLMREQP